MSRFYPMTRAAWRAVAVPVARAALRVGLTPDVVTVAGTVGSVAGSLTLLATGHLWWGAVAVAVCVLTDMLDGTMARERGGGTAFGAVLDATCDRLADGAIFVALLWWAAFGLADRPLAVATGICLVTSQVISYIKARAEASGLRGDGGVIERQERLVIVLAGAGFSDFPLLPLPWLLPVAMWLLAAASVVTLAQRVRAVRASSGAPARPDEADPGAGIL